MRKTISIIVLILGIGLFTLGSYISYEAMQGENRLSQAEANAGGGRRPIIGPVRKSVRANASANAQEKMSAAEQKIIKSQMTAHWFQGSGIVLFLAGIGFLIFRPTPNKNS